MNRVVIALLCCVLTAFNAFANEEEAYDETPLSTPDQIASLRSISDFLIGGLISPLSGQPVLRQTDLIVKGSQELILNRVYIPPHIPCSFPREKHQKGDVENYSLCLHLKDNYKGWQFFPHLELYFFDVSRTFRVSDPNGMTLDFRIVNGTTTLSALPYAINNVIGDTPGGEHDPRNTRIEYHGNRIIVHAANGTTRFYFKFIRNNINESITYLLEKEILPNGKILKYHYQKNAFLVESKDPKELHTYAALQKSGIPKQNKCHFISNIGINVDYNYFQKHLKGKIKQTKKPKRRGSCDRAISLLTSVSSPFYRNETITHANPPLLESFSGKNDNFLCGYLGFGSEPHYRVHHIHLPVGHSDALQVVHTITYDPPIAGQKDGSTTVTHSDGTVTTYHFSKSMLPTSVRYLGQDGSLKKEKIYSWTLNHWLKSIEIKDGQNKLLSKKSYDYDRFGNPNFDEFSGDFAGSGQIETHWTRKTFSEDGRNLLLREEAEEGKVTCFSYLPNTNLITSKLTKDHDKIILREFSHYDDCNNLVRTIIDDGTSPDQNDLTDVTQRTMKNITLKQQPPFLHMPEWIEEKYLENGQEKLKKRTHLGYDQHGNVNKEEIYDANGDYAYTLTKEYNERGTLISETNAIGQKAEYGDDARGRVTSITNFSNRLEKELRYDTKGRLREQTEKGDDGIVHSRFFEYDFHDRLVQKIDPFKNTTRYSNDPLVNKVTRTDFPHIASPTGESIPVVTSSTYDPLGNEITHTDANGHATLYRYNAYGSPTEILYPDGAQESFRYTKNGDLASHTDPDGLTIRYRHDIQGRVLSKTYISNEEELAEEIFTYNGFHLLTETDKAGYLTLYAYDGAGRKICEERCGRIAEYEYDALGRLALVRKHNQQNTLIIHYKRDLLDRIIEETKADLHGNPLSKITYTYDEDGNKKTQTRYIHGQEATETFIYDSLQRLTEYKDALGHIHRTIYDENHINPLAQKVLKEISINPLNITTARTYDALSRFVKKETIGTQGQTTSSREMTYDPAGNHTIQQDHVYQNGQYASTQTFQYSYTPDNQIESLTRAFGSRNARTTTYSYFPSGKIATKTLPDGVTLSYSYYPLKFLSRLDSSDNAIHHSFEYDLLGNLTSAWDENQNIVIKRKIDPFGNILQEEFPLGITIEKDHDDLNRPTSLKIGNLGRVSYEYDPLFLRIVTRFSKTGEANYTHQYDKYDLDGNLISENLIGNLGQVVHDTDLKGQKTGIASPYFSQTCIYDPAGNLLRSILDKTEHTYTYDDLSQLTSEDQSFIYAHDSLYNRTQKNDDILEVNELNELCSSNNTTCFYDLNGNQRLKQTPSETFTFTHDPLNRLVEATSTKNKVAFTYDPLGRRLSKTVYDQHQKKINQESYLYDGQNEIGAFSDTNTPKNLKIPGIRKLKNNPTAIAIELNGQIYVPFFDIQGNVRRLIDLKTGTIANSYEYTAFGEEHSPPSQVPLFNPWRFASKRFDPELGLIYFGKRYYDPEFGRWLQTDPAGFVDSINLYQYVYNNPFRYVDPDGQFAILLPLLIWGAELAAPSLSAIAVQAIYGVIAGAACYAGYVAIEALNKDHHAHTVWDIPSNMPISKSATSEETKKKKQIDSRLPSDPDDLLKDPEWKETSHPKAKEQGHRTFENKKTGEKLRYDEASPGAAGHEGESHWHRFNPDKTGKLNEYLNANDKPVPRHSEDSHLYPNE